MNKWDKYFSQISKLTASMSKCERLKVGAVLVRENRIIATGYNGLPSGYEPDICEECDKTLSEVIHAEMNVILDCAKRGISCSGATLYVTHSPCNACASSIAQAGISEVKYLEDYRTCSNHVFEKCNVKLIKLEIL